MSITKIRYNNSLFKKRVELENQIKAVDNLIKESRNQCDHIMIGLGYYGTFQYRDNTYIECLFCREKLKEYKSLNSKFIDATSYKVEVYGDGFNQDDREKRLADIQSLYIEIIKENPNISEDEIINTIRKEIIEENKETQKLEKKLGIRLY